MEQDVWYDYEVQAWIVDGKIAKCGHSRTDKLCYACIHAGEDADLSHKVRCENGDLFPSYEDKET